MKKHIFILLLAITIVLFIIVIKPTSSTPITLADTVISFNKGSTWSSDSEGVYYTNNHEYRYIGRTVNNYVKFNNDMYRIIGVFDDNSHGVTGKKLVKLIRDRIFDGFSWGVYNTTNNSGTYGDYKNDWGGSVTGVKANLNVLLNEYFYNKVETSTTYGNCSDWTYNCYFGNNFKGNSCNTLVGYGINPDYKNYIENVTWYLNGYSSNNITVNNLYLCERGQLEDDGCKSANSGAYGSTSTGYIGLMYGSDYVYAAGRLPSGTTNAVGSLSVSGKNWMFSGPEWILFTKSDSDNSAFYIGNNGTIVNNYTYINSGFRPVFYLKEAVYITGGDGSFSNPYLVACDNCNTN